jgi:hypothetical protein
MHLQDPSFIAAPSTAVSLHRKPASAGTPRDSCGGQDNSKANAAWNTAEGARLLTELCDTVRSCSRYSVVAARQLYTCFRNIHRFSQCRRRRKGQKTLGAARAVLPRLPDGLLTPAPTVTKSLVITVHYLSLLCITASSTNRARNQLQE